MFEILRIEYVLPVFIMPTRGSDVIFHRKIISLQGKKISNSQFIMDITCCIMEDKKQNTALRTTC